MITKETVLYTANLARINVTPEDLEKFSRQLEDILKFIDKLNDASTAEVEISSHILPVTNRFRPDMIKESLSQDEVLANAPHERNGLFAVPKIIE